MTRTVVSFLLLTMTGWALGQAPVTRQDPSFVAKSHYGGFFAGRSELILGSEDERFGGGVFYGFGRPDPRLKFGYVPAQQVAEVYLDRTHSKGANGDPTNDSYALGVLEYGRWRFKSVYFDLGLGLQFQNRATTDLPSYLNSTPMLGVGFVSNSQGHDLFTGVRLLHISNARTKHKNPGQNELFLMVGIRF